MNDSPIALSTTPPSAMANPRKILGLWQRLCQPLQQHWQPLHWALPLRTPHAKAAPPCDRLTSEDIKKMLIYAEELTNKNTGMKGNMEAKPKLKSYDYSLKNQLSDKEKLGGKWNNEETTARLKEVINVAGEEPGRRP